MTRMGDLLGPDPMLLPGDSEAEAELEAGENPAIVAAAHPTASVAWAVLAEEALADDKVDHRLCLRQDRLPPRSRPVAPQRLEGFRPGTVRARTQPRLPAVCGRARQGGRRDRRNRRVRALSGSARRLRPDGASRTRAQASNPTLLRSCSRRRRRVARPERSRVPGRVRSAPPVRRRVPWRSRRWTSGARSPCPCRAPASTRAGRAPRSRPRPHKRGAQLLDVDMGGR